MKLLLLLLASASLALVRGQEEEVALVLGGIEFCTYGPGGCDGQGREDQSVCEDLNNGIIQLKTAELFGCDDYVNELVSIPDFPYTVTFASGVWMEEEQKVIVCGGLDCFNLEAQGSAHHDCYWWDPANPLEWIPGPDLTQGRAAHIMGVINRDGKDRPFTIGGYPDQSNRNFTTEIWMGGNTFEPYEDLPAEFEPHNNAYGCMLHDGDMVYSIRTRITGLNLRTWQVTNYGSTEDGGFYNGFVGQCALGTRRNEKGILLISGGKFFSLESRVSLS
jgi:hypothetical protein